MSYWSPPFQLQMHVLFAALQQLQGLVSQVGKRQLKQHSVSKQHQTVEVQNELQSTLRQ